MNSTDKTHGKMGHLCSTLCGAAMLREQHEAKVKRAMAPRSGGGRGARSVMEAEYLVAEDERIEVRSSDQYEGQR